MVAGRQETHLDVEAFWWEFGRVEHESLEFKRSANNLREVIPAMAMAAGGRVVLGVDDGRRLVGCPLDQSTLDAVMRRAQECGVDVTVEPLVVGTVPLTLITVPEVTDRIVTTPDGRLLRRIGSDNLPLRADQVSEFVRARMSVRGRLQRRLKRTLRAWLGPDRSHAPRGATHPAPET